MSPAGRPEPLPAAAAEALRRLAESAARVGGAVAREAFGRTQVVSLKGDRSEVTEIDIAAQRAIVAHLRAQRPDDAFVGEESAEADSGPSAAPPDSEIWWIIDPIDGTRNYIRGVPSFSCSVAAMRGGVPVAGAVYEPIADLMYTAALGGGARINGRPAAVHGCDADPPAAPPDKLLVAVPSARREATRRLVSLVVERHVVRNYGSVALHLAMVAAGQLDAAAAGNPKLWDIAAGLLLVTEAGGVVTAPDGAAILPLDPAAGVGRELPVLAGSRAAHARLLRELAASAR